MFDTSRIRTRVVLQVILTVAIVPFVVPLSAMVAKSVEGAGWSSYAAVLSVPGFFRFFGNAAVISAGAIAIIYVATMMAAFAFSKLRIRNKEVYFWMLMAAL